MEIHTLTINSSYVHDSLTPQITVRGESGAC